MRVIITGAMFLAALHLTVGSSPAVTSTEDRKTADLDIGATVREWNSDRYFSPPTHFRPGHVTPRPLDERARTGTKNGFVWQMPGKTPVPTPTVYEGKLYVGGGFHSREFYCLDAETGRPVWALNLDDDGPTSAACRDGIIIFNTESCTIFAVDARTGRLLWALYLGDPLISTPTIANGRVFTAYPARGAEIRTDRRKAPPCSHVLAALDLLTGKILWQRWIDSDVMSAPVAVGEDLYVTSLAGVVYKFRQEDGTILSAARSRATSAPVVVGDQVFLTRRADDKGIVREEIIGGGRSDLKPAVIGYAKAAPYLDASVQAHAMLKSEADYLDANNGLAMGGYGGGGMAGKPAMNIGQSNVSIMQSFQGSRVLNYRDQNFTCMGDELVCADPSTGRKKWTVKMKGDLKREGGFLASPPAAAGGQLFVATLTGEVLQINPLDGKVKARFAIGEPLRAQPAIEGGKIYVGTQTGKVVCIDTGDKTFTGWPCSGANAAHTGLSVVP
jgi:outer membrane protein assembly factor BamB